MKPWIQTMHWGSLFHSSEHTSWDDVASLETAQWNVALGIALEDHTVMLRHWRSHSRCHARVAHVHADPVRLRQPAPMQRGRPLRCACHCQEIHCNSWRRHQTPWTQRRDSMRALQAESRKNNANSGDEGEPLKAALAQEIQKKRPKQSAGRTLHRSSALHTLATLVSPSCWRQQLGS